MPLSTPSSPHLHVKTNVTTVMLWVIYALVPGIAVYAWFFGWGVIINVVLAIATAIASEAILLKIRKRALRPFLSDGSAVVTAILLALALPPLAPWWIPVVGTAFAIVIAKQLYGGLGNNIFNPAMVGYVMLLISFPRYMTTWLAPHMLSQNPLGLHDSLSLVFLSQLPPGVALDALTMATPLDTIKTQLGLERNIDEIITASPLFGLVSGKAWEWINAAFLLGGVWLMHKRLITWHIPVGLLGALSLMALIFYVIDPAIYTSPLFHIFSGGAILGAFFIATDPVTAATSLTGKIIYGAGIGILTYIIRTWGGYPDGIAFAVLLMNMTVPTIDYYTRPRVYGHNRD